MAHPPHVPARTSTSASAVRIHSVPQGSRHSVLFLAGYTGLDTHRNPKQPIACDGYGECSHCKRRLPIIWKGYAPILLWEPSRSLWHPYVLEITETLEELIRDRNLRGEVWELERRGPGRPNDPLFGDFIEVREGRLVIEPFDILPVLLRLYHATSLKLGRANNMAPKLLLPAIEGEAPRSKPRDDQAADQAEEKAPQESFRSMRERFEGRRVTDQEEQTRPADRNGKAPHHLNGEGRK